MLDAETYPRAYFILGNKKVELSDVILKNQFITGKFIIKRNKKMKI